MAKVLNITEAVKLLKTSRPTLYRAMERGIVVPASTDGGPKFEAKSLQQQWRKWKEYGALQSRHTEGMRKGGRPAKTTPAASDDPVEQQLRGGSDAEKLIKAKAIQATLTAQKAQLELQQLRNEVMPVEEVRRQGAKLGGILIGAINAMPSRLAPQVVSLTDVRAIHDGGRPIRGATWSASTSPLSIVRWDGFHGETRPGSTTMRRAMRTR